MDSYEVTRSKTSQFANDLTPLINAITDAIELSNHQGNREQLRSARDRLISVREALAL
jgi:hypothetical protein